MNIKGTNWKQTAHIQKQKKKNFSGNIGPQVSLVDCQQKKTINFVGENSMNINSKFGSNGSVASERNNTSKM